MAEDRNKIAQALTDEELTQFVEDLIALPAAERTLAAIKAKAAERNIAISLESARTFRNTTFARHLDRLRRRKEKAQSIAAMVGDGTGRTLNEAALGIMAEQIFDELSADADATGDDEEPSRIDLDKMDALTKAAARIQKGFGEVDRVKMLLSESQAKLREYEVRDAERKKKAAEVEKDEALDDGQKAAKWRQIFGMA
jgi:hypothetical protein